jgi:hypothetical protein
MMKAILYGSAWGLATGLKVEVTTRADEILQASIDKLEGMWPGPGKQILEDIVNSIPSHDEGMALQERLLQKLHDNSAFVFAAFGSSVSAGHDNIKNQSWPFELERILKPTFKSLGFDFELRQRSAGGYGEMPFAAGCLASRAGEGVDALSWEWHMFHDAPCEGHHFLAEAAAMKSSPMVFAFAGSGIDFEDRLGSRECKKTREDVRQATLRHDDTTFALPRVWRPNEWYFTEEFVSSAEADQVVQKAGACGKTQDHFRADPTMTWLQQTGVAPPWERAGHAMYPISVAAATKHVLHLPWYQAREKALNVNWHPGPLGHTLIASSIARFFLTNLQSALAQESRRGKGPSADNPLVGKPIIGQLNEPQCGSLRALQCNTGMNPTTESNHVSLLRDPLSDDTWELQTSRQAAEGRVETVDKRTVFSGTKASGELKLNFQADSDDTYVILCGAPCGWKCGGNAGWVASKSQRWWPDKGQNGEPLEARKNVSDLRFSIDGRGISNTELNKLHDEIFHSQAGKFCPNCKNPADLCQPVAKVGKGKHTVGARVEPSSRDPRFNGEDMFVEIMEMLLVG